MAGHAEVSGEGLRLAQSEAEARVGRQSRERHGESGGQLARGGARGEHERQEVAVALIGAPLQQRSQPHIDACRLSLAFRKDADPEGTRVVGRQLEFERQFLDRRQLTDEVSRARDGEGDVLLEKRATGCAGFLGEAFRERHQRAGARFATFFDMEHVLAGEERLVGHRETEHPLLRFGGLAEFGGGGPERTERIRGRRRGARGGQHPVVHRQLEPSPRRRDGEREELARNVFGQERPLLLGVFAGQSEQGEPLGLRRRHLHAGHGFQPPDREGAA